MKEQLEELEQWGADVIFGRARGFRAGLMRLVLRGLSGVMRLVVKARVGGFLRGYKEQHHLGTLVVSVGNLTVGGTGKTPVVELLTKTLRDRGRKVAILSRGYKSRRLGKAQFWLGQNGVEIAAGKMPKVVRSLDSELLLSSKFAGDEPYMLAGNLPGVAVLVDKDRIKSARFAVGELGVDTLVLDDGMQYLRLAHSIDIVLVDSRSPFGTGTLLPAGTLREPKEHLRRASYIFLTKCDGSAQDELIREIRRYNADAELMECTHGPCYLQNVFTGERMELEEIRGKYVGAISGIAVPESFENELIKLGVNVEVRARFSDHHRFTRREIEKFMARCVDRDLDFAITTEKDAVRFPQPRQLEVPVYYLRIEVKILRGQEVWDRMIERLCAPAVVGDPLLHLHPYLDS